MTEFRYIHLGVNFGNFPFPTVLDDRMNSIASDWIRYSANNWILWSNKSLPECSHFLKGLLSLHETFVMFEIQPGTPTDGMTYDWVWKWINTARDPATGKQRVLSAAEMLAALAPSSGTNR